MSCASARCMPFAGATIVSTSTANPLPRVAFDIMGGDHAPAAALEAAHLVRGRAAAELVLIGPRDVLEGAGFEWVEASEVVTMDDKPARITREKPHSSMKLAVDQVH